VGISCCTSLVLGGEYRSVSAAALIHRGKTTESDLHPKPITNPNPNPYLVAVR